MTEDDEPSIWSSPEAKKRAQGSLGFAEARRAAIQASRDKRNWKGRDVTASRPKRPLLGSPADVAAYWANHPARPARSLDGMSEERRARIKALAHGEDDEPIRLLPCNTVTPGTR